MRLFVCGTLLDPDLRCAILGPAVGRLSLMNAILRGYRCVAMHGGVCPALRRDTAARVHGCVLADTDRIMELRLMAYEGDRYHCVCRPVEISGIGLAMAGLFLTTSPPPTESSWSLTEWQHQHQARALRQVV